MFLDSYSVLSICSDHSSSVSFKSEFDYMLSCFMLCYKLSFISKCFYTTMITNEIGCLVSMIGRLLSTIQFYYIMSYLNNVYSLVTSGLDLSITNNVLLLSISTVNVSTLFDVTSVFRLTDEYYVLRFYLKG